MITLLRIERKLDGNPSPTAFSIRSFNVSFVGARNSVNGYHTKSLFVGIRSFHVLLDTAE